MVIPNVEFGRENNGPARISATIGAPMIRNASATGPIINPLVAIAGDEVADEDPRASG